MARLDPFLLMLIAAVALASFLPGRGDVAVFLHIATVVMIAVMFFLQGARLNPSDILEAVRDWRLQSSILVCTFLLFPVIGLLARQIAPHLFTPDIWRGIIFLCCLPSTVQSSIALTSIARGNVPAAICGATVSNIAGIFVTPVLVGILVQKGHVYYAHAIFGVIGQLLLPFLMGQFLQRRLGKWVKGHHRLLTFTDRGSIVLVVYTAFSHAVIEGIWHRVSLHDLAYVAIGCFALLAIILSVAYLIGRNLQLSSESVIALMFCGSKKSLASGVPMANILFPVASVGMVVLPLMMFHQVQLFTCTLLARRFARRNSVA